MQRTTVNADRLLNGNAFQGARLRSARMGRPASRCCIRCCCGEAGARAHLQKGRRQGALLRAAHAKQQAQIQGGSAALPGLRIQPYGQLQSPPLPQATCSIGLGAFAPTQGCRWMQRCWVDAMARAGLRCHQWRHMCSQCIQCSIDVSETVR